MLKSMLYVVIAFSLFAVMPSLEGCPACNKKKDKDQPITPPEKPEKRARS